MSNVHGCEALVGAWRLLSWENRAADGEVTYPMGTDALGSLLYTADAASVSISRRGRVGFAAGDLLGGTAEEKARAVEGFVAYAGHYSFHGDRVIHHVELSLFPNWVGTDQQRSVEHHRGSADPQRQATAPGGQATGAPPGLGAGRSPPRAD